MNWKEEFASFYLGFHLPVKNEFAIPLPLEQFKNKNSLITEAKYLFGKMINKELFILNERKSYEDS
jgi:hypothetical protein